MQNGNTPLHEAVVQEAAKRDQTTVVEALISAGASPNFQNNVSVRSDPQETL